MRFMSTIKISLSCAEVSSIRVLRVLALIIILTLLRCGYLGKGITQGWLVLLQKKHIMLNDKLSHRLFTQEQTQTEC